jgi:hypothetical protein
MMFAVVQANNLYYIGRHVRAAGTPEAREMCWPATLVRSGAFRQGRARSVWR